MDFNLDVAKEAGLEGFREEVRQWLGQNVPKGAPMAVDPIDHTYEESLWRRELGRKMGEKGWVYPTYPTEYGGGGLSVNHAIVIELEMERLGLTNPPYYNPGGTLGGPTILIWGSEEQKKHFLPNIFNGTTCGWQLLSEPQGGSDLATCTTKAIKDGDDYIVNGTKTFVGNAYDVDYFWTIVTTDPSGPRHKNLGWFIIPADLPGISRQFLDLFTVHGQGEPPAGRKNTIFFDNVRVPAFNLIGGENNGWEVAHTHLEYEHGGAGRIRRIPNLLEMFKYCKETGLSQDPDARDLLADIKADMEVNRLFGLRNFWMSRNKKKMSYEGSQAHFNSRMFALHTSQRMQELLGYFALTKDPEWTPGTGRVEVYTRLGLGGLHGGGTHDTDRVIISRRMGLGRTVQEQAGQMAVGGGL
jgi:alkylation response protein AidB-like acyl-CoA dehydrogenase